ncbi:MAG: N-6 DNA methylase [Flavobacteriaceae bacterium]|nr:MAG: N-6 DNA methylase [Flavobacteriaceae bacterium]
MSKSTKYLPNEFKTFNNAFESLSRRHGYYYVFEDFLDLYINAWCFDYQFNRELIQNRYTLEERQQFTLMMYEVIKILDKEIQSDSDCYDFFGTFYESAALSKQKGFAQFFTPMPICNFMAQIVAPNNNETFSDPCCGSGRFSLASNSVSLGSFHFLVDLDFTCAKMATLNLMHHGIHGIVIADNGLFPGNDFKGAFVVNRKLPKTGIPQIEYIDNAQQAYNYVRYTINPFDMVRDLFPRTNKTHTSSPKTTDDYEDIKTMLNEKTGQFSMF